MRLFTIGYGQKTAEHFFDLLMKNDVRVIADVRLKNHSQLAGFTKYPDIEYFLQKIADIDYIHLLYLSTEEDLLRRYRGGKVDWDGYEKEYLASMKERGSIEKMKRDIVDRTCLMCSEPNASRCHRGIAAREFAKAVEGVTVIHL